MQRQIIEIKQFGAANLLKVEDISFDTELSPNDVSIEVHYSGINFADVVMRLGLYRDAPKKPFIPGYEVSGYIRKVGSAVTKYKIGDQVMAGTRFGGYASHVTIPEWQVIPLPKNITLSEGAALPVNYITAHIALNEFARMRAGDKILIECATGGVGVMAMQMAKLIGANVIGLTTTPSKKAFIESYGARALTVEEFQQSNERDFDFILNASGGNVIKDQYKRLKKSGKLTCIGMQAAINDGKSNMFKFMGTVITTPWFPLVKLVMDSKMVSGFNALKYFDDDEWMKNNLSVMEQIEFKPHVCESFKATDVSSAHQFLENKKAKGKVVIEWNH
jgi:2-desacetyl-2-hydroxyethyl bacteriochlorophyllide A dehydrogenase